MNGGVAVSYEINYSGNRVRKLPVKRMGPRSRSLTKLVCIMLACLVSAVALRDKAERFWRMTFPEDSQMVSDTVSAFLEGDSVADVIAAFCESVLSYGK